MRPRSLLVLIVVALVAASCGDDGGGDTGAGGADVFAELEDLGEPLDPELVRRAEEEGSVSIYTSNRDLEDMVGDFEREYDITVEVYRAGSETLIQRALEESSAGQPGADVIDTNSVELDLLDAEGVLAAYDPGITGEVRRVSGDRSWLMTRLQVFTVAWNEDLIGPEGPPRSWLELAEPQWKGKVALELGDYDWYSALHGHLVEEGMSEQEADEFFERLADGAPVVDGHSAQIELMVAGEFPVVASGYAYTVDRAAAEGAPVSWRPPVEPVITRPSGIAVAEDARHPAAAALFLDWMLTRGQELLAERYHATAVVTEDDPLVGLESVEVDIDALADDSSRWSEKYEELIS